MEEGRSNVLRLCLLAWKESTLQLESKLEHVIVWFSSSAWGANEVTFFSVFFFSISNPSRKPSAWDRPTPELSDGTEGKLFHTSHSASKCQLEGWIGKSWKLVLVLLKNTFPLKWCLQARIPEGLLLPIFGASRFHSCRPHPLVNQIHCGKWFQSQLPVPIPHGALYTWPLVLGWVDFSFQYGEFHFRDFGVLSDPWTSAGIILTSQFDSNQVDSENKSHQHLNPFHSKTFLIPP